MFVCWLLVVSCLLCVVVVLLFLRVGMFACCSVFVVSGRLLGLARWLLAGGLWLLVVGCWLLVVSCWSLVIRCLLFLV